MSQLFEYAVLLAEKRDKDGEVVTPAAIVTPVTQVLAANQKQAEHLAARSAPATAVTEDSIDRLQVMVRPFLYL